MCQVFRHGAAKCLTVSELTPASTKFLATSQPRPLKPTIWKQDERDLWIKKKNFSTQLNQADETNIYS